MTVCSNSADQEGSKWANIEGLIRWKASAPKLPTNRSKCSELGSGSTDIQDLIRFVYLGEDFTLRKRDIYGTE